MFTDKRKNVYSNLAGNPQIEIAGYNVNTRKWIFFVVFGSVGTKIETLPGN